MNDLLRRQAATEATLTKYRNKECSWAAGVTCLHLCRYHLKQMGHKVPTLPRLRSEYAARKELKARGWANVAAMLDSILPRIAPAFMMLGDLAVAGSADGMGAILVCAGPHKLLGWREDAPVLVVLDVTLDELDGVWRA